jgi:hypothetical protein
MSKNRNRAKLNKAQNGREYHQIGMNEVYPMYWDEGIMCYPRYRKGFRNPNKVLQRYKQREYRTWKYNRLEQWKE